MKQLYCILLCLLSITFRSFGQDDNFSKAMALRIDSILEEGLKEGAYPGCQVFIFKQGVPVYNKSVGFQDQTKQKQVQSTDLYDLASLSKTTGTLLAVMKLHDLGKLHLSDRASRYVKAFRTADKRDITIEQLLFHQSGLPPYLLFYKKIPPRWITSTQDAKHPTHVAEGMWLNRKFKKRMLQQIQKAPIGEKEYVYSCIGFITLQQVVEQITQEPMDEFLKREIYAPMGLTRIDYLPLRNFKREEIIPTETDTLFRKQVLRGYVHDEAAACLGGISGNAGLFASAEDVAKVYQMLLNKGTYNGHRILQETTCDLFTTRTSSISRRGLGFDKASPRTYGHTGFTGTCAWVDPGTQTVYVFLSNRVCPTRSNNLLSKLNIRSRIQEVLYNE